MPPAPTLYVERRLHRVRESFDELSIDALVITHVPNIFYLTNHAGSAGVAVLTRKGVHLLVDFRYQETVRRTQESAAACPGLRIWNVPASYDEALVSTLGELGVARVGIEAAHLTVSRFDWLQETVAARGLDIELRRTERVVERSRVVKDAHELAMIREAAGRLDEVARAAFDAVRPGESERSVAAVIEAALRAAGFDRTAFDTIVASGPNSALPHYRAGDRRLAPGDLVVLDFGGVLDGYCCDLTRTVVMGPVGAESRRIYDAVLRAQSAAIAAVAPGALASDIDAAARGVLQAEGFGDAFGHGTGHGLGIEVHEEPRITRRRADDTSPHVRLEPGMVFTVEPGAYLPGFGGVRIEDDVQVTADGCEILTPGPRELLVLGSSGRISI